MSQRALPLSPRRCAAGMMLLAALAHPATAQVATELDAYWMALARTVAEGDFEGYAAGYHPDAVLVSLGGNRSYPIAQALGGWKQGFDDTKAGTMMAGVEFRFSQRLTGPATAHETGMFRYVSQQPGQDPDVALIHFNALLVKKDGAWLTMMEYQREPGTEAEWAALPGPGGNGHAPAP